MNHSPAAFIAFVLTLCSAAVFPAAASLAIPGSDIPAIARTLPDPDAGIHDAALQARATGRDRHPILRAQDSSAFGSRDCSGATASIARAGAASTRKSCLDAAYTQKHFSIQLGRRVGTHRNVLGQFDGVRVDLRLADGLTLNGVAGYPVLADEDVFNTSRQVFGIGLASDPLGGAWNMNGYLVEQQENGQVTGRSVGGAVQQLLPEHSLLMYLDYDLADYTLGAFLASGAWKIPGDTTLSATLGLHNRALPERQQKYLEQTMTATDGWDWSLPAERLAFYSGTGWREVGILDIGLSRTLSSRLRLNGDILLLDAGVATDAEAAGAGEYLYQMKLMGKDLLLPGDRSGLGLRHAVTRNGRSDSATLDGRYTLNQFWNLIPQLRADYRSAQREGASGWVASPNVKLEYRRGREFGLHIEAGSKVPAGTAGSEADAGASYFVSLGLQAEF